VLHIDLHQEETEKQTDKQRDRQTHIHKYVLEKVHFICKLTMQHFHVRDLEF